MIKLRIGIVGFGKLGQYLYGLLQGHPEFEIAFVWNRTKHVLIDCNVAPSLVLDKLENIFELEVDLIVEVAHPAITHKFLFPPNLLAGGMCSTGNCFLSMVLCL